MPALPPLALRTPATLALALLVQVSAVPGQTLPRSASMQYLKAGDALVIHMRGAPRELSVATYVQRSGSIEVAPAGVVQVDGLSLKDAAQQVETALEAHFSRPSVTLTPIALADPMFFITGDVRNPGSYPARRGLTVRQAVIDIAGNVSFWCQHGWYFRLFEYCAARVSIVRPDAQGNLAYISSEVTDWFRTGLEPVRAGDLISVRVDLDHPPPD
jgi:hypothetical protein